MKETIQLLNIPNYYCSYYLFALSERFALKYSCDPKFKHFDNRAFLIFRYRDKVAVLDTNDPSGTKSDLYAAVDFYFVTNKLKTHPSYQQDKIIPLYPHFPINTLGVYLRVFGLSLLRNIPFMKLVHQLHIQRKRPKYQAKGLDYKFHNYVFFSANLWKKEPWTNQVRAAFIRACKNDPRINFEGGFVPREDGDAMGFENELNEKLYSPKVFSRLSAETNLALNNPAVLGAVSWRLAEYLAAGIFVISYPFAIELPSEPKHGEEMHYVEEKKGFQMILDKIFEDKDYHKAVSKGGYDYFNRHCTPEAQVEYILSFFQNP